MRILLTSNASHDPPRGGSTRGNLVWLDALARAGHACAVVCGSISEDARTERGGIPIFSVRDLARRRDILSREIREFAPDFVLVSSEDLSHLLLREARAAAPDRLVYLAHTPQFFPFGPESWNRDPRGADIVRSARAVVTIGCHMQAYVREHLGVEARVVHPPVYGEPPFARFGSFDSGDVLMINPCAVKGIAIFLELARMFPGQRFAALKGWGTTGADLRALQAEPNIAALDTVGAIEEVFARTKILLVPSLWYEGFGLVAMEAMLRGIPVIASDSGGLAEAKRGTRFIVPVRPITRYAREFDENHMPLPLDGKLEWWEMDAWGKSLHVLLTRRDVYEEESELSRRVALDFVSRLRASQFEEMLAGLRR